MHHRMRRRTISLIAGAPRGSEDLYLCRRGAVDYSTDPQCISSLGSGDSAYSSHDVETALAYLAAERPQQEWQVRMPAAPDPCCS